MHAVAKKLGPAGIITTIVATITLLVALVYAVNSNASQTGWRSAAPDSPSMEFIVAQTPPKIAAIKSVNAILPAPTPKPVIDKSLPTVYSIQVHAGDTLSSIAAKLYGSSKYWTVLYWSNHIKDPNLITIGQTLKVPPRPLRIPAAPHFSTPAPAPVLVAHVATSQAPSQSSPAPTENSGGLSGFLSYSGLEQLWVAAGGNPAYEATAACIAEHESGGNQYALSPTNDYGYWQINGSNGSLATYDAYGNARSAIILSNDGTDWHLWTTHIYCGV